MILRPFIVACAVFICSASAFAQTITNPDACDFDGDSSADTLTVVGKRGTAVLSKKGNTVRVTFDKAYSFFTCRDSNDDNKTEIYARKTEGGRAKIFFVGRSQSGLLKVCKSLRELKSCEIWKSKQSPHIHDQRQRSTGFITLRGCPGSFPNPIVAFDAAGAQIHVLGEYVPTGTSYDNRHYGCYGKGDCKSPQNVAKEANKNTGKEEIYLRDSAGVCIRVPDPGQCYNSIGC